MITLVKNIRQLVTAEGTDPRCGSQMSVLAVREGVSLVLRDDRIAAIETRPDIRADRVIDAAGGVVVPGLVDPCLTLESRLPSSALDDEPARGLRVTLETLLRHGTTSCEVRATRNGAAEGPEQALADLHLVARHVPLQIASAFLCAPHVAVGDGRADRISALIGETIPSVSRRRLASTCVVLCGEEGYSRKEARSLLRAARGAGLSLKVQACGSGVDAALLASDLDADAIDHVDGETLGPRASAQLKRAGIIAIALPAASFAEPACGGSPRPLVDAGLAVAFGTGADLLRGGVLSQWTGVALAVRRLGLSLAEALVAATLNAAAALGIAHAAGTLEPGKRADFAVLDLDDVRRIPDFIVGLPLRCVVCGGREVEAR